MFAFVLIFILLSVVSSQQFDSLKQVFKRINELEDIVNRVKYIYNEKVNLDLMGGVIDVDLYCQEFYPQEIITYKKAAICLSEISKLIWKGKISFNNNDFGKITRMFMNWEQHLNTDFVNFKVILLETIHTYVNSEKELHELYSEFISKEKIIELMKQTI